MIVDYAPVCTSEEKRKRERKKERKRAIISTIFPRKRKEKQFHSIFKILLLFVINKTRFYTHAGIEHTREIVLSVRSTTGIVF